MGMSTFAASTLASRKKNSPKKPETLESALLFKNNKPHILTNIKTESTDKDKWKFNALPVCMQHYHVIVFIILNILLSILSMGNEGSFP